MEDRGSRLTYYLATGLSCRGNLQASGVMHIEGVFEGSIIGEGVLIIGGSAETKSDVEVDTVIIAGSFTGKLISRKKVSILHGATVRGTVQAPICDVEHGATIHAEMSITRAE